MTVVHAAGYDVHIERGGLASLGAACAAAAPAHRYAIVADDTVAALFGARARATYGDGIARLFTVPAGEAHKTRESWARLTDALLAAGFGRDTTVVALGGGVVGDLAGFVAATFMRGVPVVQVPTTLLAMVDASVGGKTGVDTPAGKNLVGAFHPPALVLADPEVLLSLPPDELRGGLAEVLKHGVIADERYLEQTVDALPSILGAGGAASDEAVRAIVRSVEIKADVVARDGREAGVRKILNFGHTLGHAIELASGYALSHGAAVAIGMVLESELAERMGVAECGTHQRVVDAVRAAGLPASRPAGPSADELLAATRLDKKARGGRVEYALPRRIGAMAGESDGWGVRVDDALVREVLA